MRYLHFEKLTLRALFCFASLSFAVSCAADEPVGGPIRINLIDPYAAKPLPPGLKPTDLIHHYTGPDVRDAAVYSSKKMPWGPSGETLHVTNYPPGRGPAGGIGTPANDSASIIMKAGDLADAGHVIEPNTNPNYEQGKNWLIRRVPGQDDIRLPPSTRGGAGYKNPRSGGGGGSGRGGRGPSGGGSGGGGSGALTALSHLQNGASVVSAINNIANSDDPVAQTGEELNSSLGSKLGAIFGSEFGPVGSFIGSLFGDLTMRALMNPRPSEQPPYLAQEPTSNDPFASLPATATTPSTPILLHSPVEKKPTKTAPLGPAPDEQAIAAQRERANQLADDTHFDDLARDLLGRIDAQRREAAEEAARQQQAHRNSYGGGHGGYGGYGGYGGGNGGGGYYGGSGGGVDSSYLDPTAGLLADPND